ncbi:MAG: M50 family metallopeptidase [Actinomycetales bacterium]|nr:M50 family metallopeptidase [Actinomycetales bacterium]
MDRLTSGWDLLVSAEPAPPAVVVLGTAALALLAVGQPRSWRLLRHVVTLAHEAGHAGVALLCGRRLRGVRLHSDTSGLTVTSGRPTGPGMVATVAAGYLAPALLGLAAALALANGYVVATLVGFLVLLAAVLVAVRNAFGVLSVLTSAALLVAVLGWAGPVPRKAFAYLLTWFLLVAAPRPVLELRRKRGRGRAADSDADQLARLTGTRGGLWVAVFLLLTLAAAATGALLLAGVSGLSGPGA